MRDQALGGAASASGSAIDLSVPFGQALVADGLASKEEVDHTVELQGQLARRGVFLRLGELLVARGILDEETVARVLERQGTAILVCPQCMSQFNVLAYQETKKYRCSRCAEFLKRPAQVQELSVEDTLVHEDWKDAFDLSAGDGQKREFGNYVILGQISRGGMGIIYKARQKSLDRIVAMKIVAKGDTAVGADARNMFNKEARAVARLRHPHIIAIHEVDRIGDVDFYTMDYIEGLPLNRAVAAEGLSEKEIVESFTKVCDAVEYANSEGILHRDIKPENILLDRKRNPILIDFGIAGEEEDQNTIIGSPAFLPPEYISGKSPYDGVGEVYALGATLWSALAGRPPHGGVDTVQILKRAGREKIKPIRSVRRTIDRDLATIVMTAVAHDPASRYPSVRELANDLRRWQEGEEIAGRSSPLTRAWNRVRGKVAAAIGLGVALLLPILTGLFTMERNRLEHAQETQQKQFERERDALHKELLEAHLESARVQIELKHPKEAEALLSRLLKVNRHKKHAGRIHALRATARRAGGDVKGAQQDEEAAKQLGTKGK